MQDPRLPPFVLLLPYIGDTGKEHRRSLDIVEAQTVNVLEKCPVYDDVYFPVFKANIDALHFVYLHILERLFKNFNLESSTKDTLYFLRPVTLVSGNYGTDYFV